MVVTININNFYFGRGGISVGEFIRITPSRCGYGFSVIYQITLYFYKDLLSNRHW